MKKKKLRKRIAELESQLGTAKQNEKIWESMFVQLMADLKGYGVKTEIIRAESPVIDVSRTEDDTPKYIHGINTMPPTLSFDFTEHDKKAICDFKEKCEYDNDPEEIKQCREFLERDNKCYIYIRNFFATPMTYESLGFSCGYQEIPIIKIKYENGIKSEVSITELQKYDTLEKCENRCKEVNEVMKKWRESWNGDYEKLRQLLRGNLVND